MSGERMEIPDGQAREAWRASLSLKRHDGVMKGPRRNRRERRRRRTERNAVEQIRRIPDSIMIAGGSSRSPANLVDRRSILGREASRKLALGLVLVDLAV